MMGGLWSKGAAELGKRRSHHERGDIEDLIEFYSITGKTVFSCLEGGY